MSLREIDLNENVINSNEGSQGDKDYIPDLNANVEELDGGFNQSPSTSVFQFSSLSPFPFDLNVELFMEDDTQLEEISPVSDSNNGGVSFNPNSSRFDCMMSSCSSSRPAKKAAGENTTGPNWLDLPTEVTANILQRLGIIEILTSARQVCPLWWNICKDPLMWRTVDMSKLRYSSFDLVKICRYAVGRSCGQLEDINIEYFGTDELLKYITDRTSSLRCLRLANCWEISNKGLSEVVKKLPWLEELDISFCYILKDSLEVIGQCCPLLKLLKFSSEFSVNLFSGDDVAFAIAKSMPELRHLNMFGNRLTSVGLLAILDGCHHLESLDLRDCFFLVLNGCLEKRCHEQIKDLLLPTHYIHIDDSSDDDDSYSDEDWIRPTPWGTLDYYVYSESSD